MTSRQRDARHEALIEIALVLCGLLENSPFDPAGVVFLVERIAGESRPLLPAIELVVHAVEGQRLDLRARSHMKIGIFVPAINVKEKLADGSCWFRRQRTHREFQGQFIGRVKSVTSGQPCCENLSDLISGRRG